MTRAFRSDPLPAGLAERLVGLARRVPAAGNSAVPHCLVLEGSDQVAEYWDLTLPRERRAEFPWPDLLSAPLLVIPFVNPDAYVHRYAEEDKQQTGLGEGPSAWTTPYWWVDGGMAVMAMLLAVEEAGLGALFFGLFEHEEAVKAQFGVPAPWRAVGALAVGHPLPQQRPSASAGRARPALGDITHRGNW